MLLDFFAPFWAVPEPKVGKASLSSAPGKKGVSERDWLRLIGLGDVRVDVSGLLNDCMELLEGGGVNSVELPL